MQFNDHMEQLKHTPAYWETAARERFADEVLTEMRAQGKDIKDLQVNRQDITAVLSCNAASFSAMCRVAFALGCRVKITLEPLEPLEKQHEACE